MMTRQEKKVPDSLIEFIVEKLRWEFHDNLATWIDQLSVDGLTEFKESPFPWARKRLRRFTPQAVEAALNEARQRAKARGTYGIGNDENNEEDE